MSSVKFTIYDTSSGEINATGQCDDSVVSMMVGANQASLTGSYSGDIYYIDTATKSPKKRPTMGASVDKTSVPADNTTASTISGIPNPTTVRVTGSVNSSATVTDGTLALTFDTPGSYIVALESFPHLPQEFTIDAT